MKSWLEIEDKKIRELIKKSNAEVIGRGAIMIDPNKVRNSHKFKVNSLLAKKICES